jgi:hypothetical protein
MQILSKDQLQRGDVLLFHGNGWLSSMIRLLDGSEYSYAGIYDGSMVVEAETVGLESDGAIEHHAVEISCGTARVNKSERTTFLTILSAPRSRRS